MKVKTGFGLMVGVSALVSVCVSAWIVLTLIRLALAAIDYLGRH
jgi:hypothetical protein